MKKDVVRKSENIYKIAHLTSVHPRFDTRIYFKMCLSLSNNNYEVFLVVADGKKNELINGIKIIDVGVFLNRIKRMHTAPKRIFDQAIELDADLYHLHDPELIIIGLKLKKLGKKVIFDSHEDVPQQIISKTYLNFFFRYLLSKVFCYYEKWACAKFDGIITSTSHINNKFLKINKDSIDVKNFPIINELNSPVIDTHRKNLEVCYVGVIGKNRGIEEMVNAMEFVNKKIKLILGGLFYESSVENFVKKNKSWKYVEHVGFLNRDQVRGVLQKSFAGLVVLHPTPSYQVSLPVKMFEYMSAGLPVIASNFPLWCDIIEGNNCGICVDPLNPKEIAEAINYLFDNPNLGVKMGKNGQNAINKKYNWEYESKKLLEFYKMLIN